jgi:hypothetical protein
MSNEVERFLFGVLLVVGMFLYSRYDKKKTQEQFEKATREREEERLSSDDYVIKQITKLEHAIVTEHSLPDAVCYSDAYIFRHLMKPWFYELAAKERYNSDRVRQLRKDMLAYMALLSSTNTHSFLSLEGKESTRERYDRAAYEEREQLKVIEFAFADLIGPKARRELEFARDVSNHNKFSPDGTLAPDGHRYVWNSLVAENRDQ